MITSSTIYWLTRLPYLNDLFFGMTVTLTIVLFLYMFFTLMHCVIDLNGDFSFFKKYTYIPIIIFIVNFICAVGIVLTPSDLKEISAIYLIPKIVNNKDVGEIPANTAKLLNVKLKEWISDNLSEAKK